MELQNNEQLEELAIEIEHDTFDMVRKSLFIGKKLLKARSYFGEAEQHGMEFEESCF